MVKKTLSSDQFLKDIQGKNLNFLIGAGASVGLVNTLDLSQLGESFEDLYSDKELNSRQRAALDLIWFKSWIQDTLITKDKMDAISVKNSKGKKVFQNYKRFINNLGEFLDREGYDKPKRANIFTTNYDSLFELVFDEVAQNQRMIYFNDGSRGFLNRYISTENFNLNISHSAMSDNFQRSIPTINLLKIHGSITWDLEKSNKKNSENSDKYIKRIKATINNEVFEKVKIAADNVMQRIELTDFPIIDALFFYIYKKDLSNDKKKSVLQNLKDELNDFNEYPKDDPLANLGEQPSPLLQEFEKEYKNLQVVNPTKDKFRETVFQQNYYQLLRMLSFELEKRDSVLIVFGFSFADEHILEIVRRSLVNPYLKVYVICFNESSKIDLERKLGNVGPNKIDFIPYTDVHDGGKYTPTGNFDYLNWLFDGKSNREE